ncbi:MAG: hypothetical protein PWQ29_1320 [Verrucomicrobiota bacterium]|jgi:hypothetical protein|nr:hypothetical protein [Verrucomicrobiota bacterium]MDK2963926.1 hypothetical protein [Verrucomicrobiota bacterium]
MVDRGLEQIFPMVGKKRNGCFQGLECMEESESFDET